MRLYFSLLILFSLMPVYAGRKNAHRKTSQDCVAWLSAMHKNNAKVSSRNVDTFINTLKKKHCPLKPLLLKVMYQEMDQAKKGVCEEWGLSPADWNAIKSAVHTLDSTNGELQVSGVEHLPQLKDFIEKERNKIPFQSSLTFVSSDQKQIARIARTNFDVQFFSLTEQFGLQDNSWEFFQKTDEGFTLCLNTGFNNLSASAQIGILRYYFAWIKFHQSSWDYVVMAMIQAKNSDVTTEKVLASESYKNYQQFLSRYTQTKMALNGPAEALSLHNALKIYFTPHNNKPVDPDLYNRYQYVRFIKRLVCGAAKKRILG